MQYRSNALKWKQLLNSTLYLSLLLTSIFVLVTFKIDLTLGLNSVADYLSKGLHKIPSIMSKYVYTSGILFVLFWVILKTPLKSRKIQDVPFQKNEFVRDFINSCINIINLGFISIVTGSIAVSSHSKLYTDINQYGYGYALMSLVVAVIALDTYFYWYHRLLHHKSIFKYFHRIHHLTKSPTPWTTFAISPVEQLGVSLFYMALICILPMHLTVFSIYVITGLVRQTIGHLGYEVFPKSAGSGWLRWSTTVVHHDMHHQYFKSNYGLYFMFWDKLMNTVHPEYLNKFDSIHAKGSHESK